jgi:hydroxymethylpyrimidine pyrophosphatase-like HAD family hydrolase
MKKLVALDLDGTLTQHKSPLELNCRKVLTELSLKYRLLMVCAGGCERVYKQMMGFSIDICGFYGMEFSTATEATDNGGFRLTESDSVPVDRELIISYADIVRNEFALNEYEGDTVEFHTSGVVTFPLLGTAARLDKKLAYDPDRKKRRQYYDKVRSTFKDYTVVIGGTSSFDIVPKPYCKLYSLDRYIKDKKISREQIIFFGDDYGIGGNDEDIYKSDIQFVTIDDYKEFPQKARSLLL